MNERRKISERSTKGYFVSVDGGAHRIYHVEGKNVKIENVKFAEDKVYEEDSDNNEVFVKNGKEWTYSRA